MYKKIVILLMGCVSLFGTEKTSLTVGTNAEFPPFSYKEGEVLVGFDIDIAKEVGKRLGKEIKFKDMPFEALLPDLMLGGIDFIAAGMSITEERGKRVNFTKSYLTGDPLVLLTLIDKKATLEELMGKVIVVNEGFTADSFISSKSGYETLRLAVSADAFLALQKGRAAAFITAKSTVDAFFAVQDPAKFHVGFLEETSESCALVFSKKNTKLLAEIQAVLDEMEKDGTLLQYKVKWKLV